MNIQRRESAGPSEGAASKAVHIKRIVVPLLQVILAVEIILLLLRGHFLSAFLASGVLMLPVFFQKLSFSVPAEAQLAAVVFSFCTLFLGEVQNFYERFWWWDLAIHFSSGLLLSVVGLLLIYMINDRWAVEKHVRPTFLAVFAFAFAVAIGGVWEVFEFGVDAIFGTEMQMPRPGDPSGLTDTMWDMCANILGAAFVSLMAVRGRNRRWRWLQRIIDRNPGIFGR